MNSIKLIELNNLPIQLIDGDRGINYPSKSEFTNNGYCVFLNTGNVSKSGFDFSNIEFISAERDLLLRKGKLQYNDIVLTTRGTIGNVGFYNAKIIYENIRINSGMIIMRCNENEIDPYYLYLFLRSEIFKKQVLSQGSGSAQPQLPIGSLKNISFPFTNLSTQQKIAKVLSDLDAKIELNNKINFELEAMAKTLYDYWFVQFDFPNANGKPYKTSGGKMVWNEELNREIPEGWKVGKLEEIENNIITGKTPSTKVEENFGGDIPFVTIDDIRKQLYVFYADRTLSKKGADSQSNKYLQPGDICVSCIGTIGVIGIIGTTCQTNQQINSISKIKDFNRFFLLNALKDYFNFNVAAKKGAVLDNMNKGDFSIIPILDAPNKLKIEYNRNVNSSYTKIEKNLKENQELASLRDWLLPMLMNGQVSVGDVAEQLGMVAENGESYGK